MVISPLIALMKDQVRAMQEKAISALRGCLSDDKATSKVCGGEIYMSPEALLTDEQ